MQKVLTLTATCLLGILLCASAALADEVKTDHFTLNLPSGWTQPQPVQSAQGATMVILQNAAEQTASLLWLSRLSRFPPKILRSRPLPI